MYRWRVVCAGALALLLSCASAPAQDTNTELYEDVRLLLTVHKLDLSSEQVADALAQAQALADKRAELAELRRTVWAEDGKHFEAVNDAWLKGKRTPGRDKRAADNALEKVQQAEKRLREAEDAAVSRLRAGLTDRQLEVVETSRQAQARRERQARMGGARTVGEFVAGKLDEVRDLMVDEYRLVAANEARAVAEAIVGPGASNVNQMAAQVLEMMNQARSWSAERYSANREQLPTFVEQFLGITEPDPNRFVSYDELRTLLTSERAVAVLTEVLKSAGGGEGQ